MTERLVGIRTPIAETSAFAMHAMNIFSLAHLLQLARHLPDPADSPNPVIRIPLEAWDSVDDAEHPAGEFEDHLNPYVEFQVVQWKNIKGASTRRWVLRGLVAI